MTEPRDYQSARDNHRPRRWAFIGALGGFVLFGVAFYCLTIGDDHDSVLRFIGIPRLSFLLLPFAMGMELVGAPFFAVIVMAIAELPVQLGIAGWLVEKKRYWLVCLGAVIHVAVALWVSWDFL